MKIKTIIVGVLTSIIMASCGETPKTPAQLKEELRQTEVHRPSWYVQLEGNTTLETQRKKVKNATFFQQAKYKDDGAIISGKFRNSATIAKFKDIEVAITYMSKTETDIRTDNFVIYEAIEPNGTIPFRIKVAPPKAYDKFRFRVTGATPIK